MEYLDASRSGRRILQSTTRQSTTLLHIRTNHNRIHKHIEIPAKLPSPARLEEHRYGHSAIRSSPEQDRHEKS